MKDDLPVCSVCKRRAHFVFERHDVLTGKDLYAAECHGHRIEMYVARDERRGLPF